MLGRLFKRSSNAELAIAVGSETVAPGQQVPVRASVGGELDDKVEQVRCGVRCVNRYKVRERDRQDDHMREVVRTAVLHEEWAELPIEPGEHERAFTIPTTAVPTATEAVGWAAVVQVVRRRGRDASESATLRVLASLEALPPQPAPIDFQPPVTFAERPAPVRAGDAVRGAVEIAPGAEELKASRVVAKLVRVQTHAAQNSEIEDAETIAEAELHGGGTFAPHTSERLPFELPVPADAPPSLRTPNTDISWHVEVKVDRRLRGDLKIDAPLAVYTA